MTVKLFDSSISFTESIDNDNYVFHKQGVILLVQSNLHENAVITIILLVQMTISFIYV